MEPDYSPVLVACIATLVMTSHEYWQFPNDIHDGAKKTLRHAYIASTRRPDSAAGGGRPRVYICNSIPRIRDDLCGTEAANVDRPGQAFKHHIDFPPSLLLGPPVARNETPKSGCRPSASSICWKWMPPMCPEVRRLQSGRRTWSSHQGKVG